jgi:predicted alpha/beta hydrolase family esterase
MGSYHCFILPGLNNSGPQHWQTFWENEYGLTRIQQHDWDTPVCNDWIANVDAVVKQYPPEEVVLVGHSLACCTIAHWARAYNRKIKAALLVGPSDVEASSYPPGTTGFTPMPLNKLPFSSIVVASTDDEYVSFERAAYFAECWGSGLVTAGALGHINSASNLGHWPAGYQILQTLINTP